ncbi:aminotransferase class IV [Microtetraspora niveoalba]|uniref:aminotransferase class IV n=1 Tax=Microtetraspora niveoalba TaxID=46175 RepID=UPI000A556E96|nr:aminotransferase class IV [Microtetraspora niveoalba]
MAIGRTVIEGRVVGTDAGLAVDARYGHFTAMQVRGGRVRGLDLHLDRLETAGRELFGAGVGRERVVGSIRAVLGDDIRDASVRVYVLLEGESPRVFATARPPVDLGGAPRSVRPVVYQRYLPHIKHVGGFPQHHLGRLVAADGYDEALLTTADGVIAEGAVTNVGCFDGETVVWPEAPMLRGITMRLLEAAMERSGVRQERRVIRVGDLPAYDGVFLTNSRGMVAVGRVGAVALNVDPEAMRRLGELYESVPWDAI